MYSQQKFETNLLFLLVSALRKENLFELQKIITDIINNLFIIFYFLIVLTPLTIIMRHVQSATSTFGFRSLRQTVQSASLGRVRVHVF